MPFKFRPEMKPHQKHCFLKPNIVKTLIQLLISPKPIQFDQSHTPKPFQIKT
jgi:hypothetical protein